MEDVATIEPIIYVEPENNDEEMKPKVDKGKSKAVDGYPGIYMTLNAFFYL